MVLIVNRLGETAGRYYFDGDSPGRWCGAARHDLGLDGVVDRRDLDAVLQGRHPAGNERLEDRPRSHRRAGWDLILTAPKSVSLLAAMAPPDVGDALESAHRRACADAFGWLETHGCWARRRTGLVATSGLIAARFGHTTSAAGDPHLHTHVLVANVVRAGDGRWSALDGSGVWLNRRTVGAVYHLALRQQTLAAGLRLRWDVHPDGSADVADVPRAAIDATSSRHRQIQERLDRGGDPSLRGRTAAQRLSRAEPAPTTRWEDRTELAGFGARAAARVLDDAMDRATPAPGAGQGALAGDVVRWLADRRSTFGLADVMQAVAASHPEGTGAATADEWARTFCDRSPRTADGRWTSALAMGRDEALVRAATARVHVDVGPARPAGGAGRGEPGPTPRLHDPVEGEKADPGVRLTTAGRGIDVLGSPLRRDPGDGWRVIGSMGGFVAQAEILGAARVEWQQSGRRVAVLTPSDDAARRWRALAGLDRQREGAPLPDVLVVDRADRRPTDELARLLADASGAGTQLVLVEGGTQPARRSPLSAGLTEIGERLGRIVPEHPTLVDPLETRLDAGRGLGSGRAAGPGAATGPGATADGRLSSCHTGRDAIERVAATWIEHGRGPGAERPQMVALGPAECDELNRRARLAARAGGRITGPDVVLAGRPFAVGDAVITTRKGVLPAGTPGQVEALTRDGGLVVRSEGQSVAVDGYGSRRLRHAYAVTPGLLRADDRPLIALAETGDLGRHRPRVVASFAVDRGPAVQRSPARERLVRAPGEDVTRRRDPPDLGLGL